MAFNAVATVVKSFLDPHTPVNHGSFNPIEIINPAGQLPQRYACRHRAAAWSSAAHLLAGTGGCYARPGDAGTRRRRLERRRQSSCTFRGRARIEADLFLMYEYPAGRHGRDAHDPTESRRSHVSGRRLQRSVVGRDRRSAMPDPGRAYGIRDGSFGDGEFRGGCGIRRDLRVLADGVSLSVLADKNIIPPYGVALGARGAAKSVRRASRWRASIEPSPIPGKVGGFACDAATSSASRRRVAAATATRWRAIPSASATDVATRLLHRSAGATALRRRVRRVDRTRWISSNAIASVSSFTRRHASRHASRRGRRRVQRFAPSHPPRRAGRRTHRRCAMAASEVRPRRRVRVARTGYRLGATAMSCARRRKAGVRLAAQRVSALDASGPCSPSNSAAVAKRCFEPCDSNALATRLSRRHRCRRHVHRRARLRRGGRHTLHAAKVPSLPGAAVARCARRALRARHCARRRDSRVRPRHDDRDQRAARAQGSDHRSRHHRGVSRRPRDRQGTPA